MPSLTLSAYELPTRIQEVPDVEDCFVVRVFNNDKDINLNVPRRPESFGLIRAARSLVGLDPRTNQRAFRIYESHFREGRLSFGEDGDGGVCLPENPIYFTFSWGEKDPVVAGIRMLLHEGRDPYCNWCFAHPGLTDCPERRLRALAASSTEEERAGHLRAVQLWHSKPPDKW
jgi:hypothetical protein